MQKCVEEGVSTPTRKHKPILEKGVVPYPHSVLSFSSRRAAALESKAVRVQQPGLDTSRMCKPPGLLSSDLFLLFILLFLQDRLSSLLQVSTSQ